MTFIYDLMFNAANAFITSLVVIPLTVLTEILLGLFT